MRVSCKLKTCFFSPQEIYSYERLLTSFEWNWCCTVITMPNWKGLKSFMTWSNFMSDQGFAAASTDRLLAQLIYTIKHRNEICLTTECGKIEKHTHQARNLNTCRSKSWVLVLINRSFKPPQKYCYFLLQWCENLTAPENLNIYLFLLLTRWRQTHWGQSVQLSGDWKG